MKSETMKDAGYTYIKFDKKQYVHVLKDNETGKIEAWFANKNHASYRIKWRNTDLEFARTYTEE